MNAERPSSPDTPASLAFAEEPAANAPIAKPCGHRPGFWCTCHKHIKYQPAPDDDPTVMHQHVITGLS